MHTFETIAKQSTPKSVKDKILQLKNFQARLHEYYDVALKQDDWKGYSEGVRYLEKSEKTYKVAQEMWNLAWLLDELANIESSIEQMNDCIAQYLKLDRGSMVK